MKANNIAYFHREAQSHSVKRAKEGRHHKSEGGPRGLEAVVLYEACSECSKKTGNC